MGELDRITAGNLGGERSFAPLDLAISRVQEMDERQQKQDKEGKRRVTRKPSKDILQLQHEAKERLRMLEEAMARQAQEKAEEEIKRASRNLQLSAPAEVQTESGLWVPGTAVAALPEGVDEETVKMAMQVFQIEREEAIQRVLVMKEEVEKDPVHIGCYLLDVRMKRGEVAKVNNWLRVVHPESEQMFLDSMQRKTKDKQGKEVVRQVSICEPLPKTRQAQESAKAAFEKYIARTQAERERAQNQAAKREEQARVEMLTAKIKPPGSEPYKSRQELEQEDNERIRNRIRAKRQGIVFDRFSRQMGKTNAGLTMVPAGKMLETPVVVTSRLGDAGGLTMGLLKQLETRCSMTFKLTMEQPSPSLQVAFAQSLASVTGTSYEQALDATLKQWGPVQEVEQEMVTMGAPVEEKAVKPRRRTAKAKTKT